MRKKRIEFLAVTWTLFIVCFLSYALLSTMMPTDHKVLSILGFGLLGGYMFSSILSGAILFARFITKKSLGFKILCSCFFLITFAGVVYVGLFSFIPYSIYNIIKIIRNNEEKSL